MRKPQNAHLMQSLVFLLTLAAYGGSASNASATDRWCGTAPLCDGSCRSGETQIKTDVRGDGAKCWSGHKALCTAIKYADPCSGGPVYTVFINWNDGGPDPYPETDVNQSEEELTLSTAGNCQNGYVWREANTSDHVCVTPTVRSETQLDNSQAKSRVNPAGGSFGPGTCLSGFVWRAAFKDDHVCVTPTTRSQAADDNSKANGRLESALPSITESWPTLSDGDCQLQNASLVYHPSGYAELTSQVRTNHAGSGGDSWVASLTAQNASGQALFAIPSFSSPSLKQNGHWYQWKVDFTFDPSKFTQINKTEMKKHC